MKFKFSERTYLDLMNFNSQSTRLPIRKRFSTLKRHLVFSASTTPRMLKNSYSLRLPAWDLFVSF
ncbi:MAG: hypothetical protein AAF599_02720, partial [Bacteroidota bacterium]